MNLENKIYSKIRTTLKRLIKGYLRNIYWDLYGRTIKNPIWHRKPRSFVYVCKGNICRSPFAHHLAKKYAGDRVKCNFTIDSAGLEAKQANRSPENAVIAGSEYGIDLKEHMPKKLDRNMIETADMVIGMETWHFKAMQKQYPEYKGKFFLLPLFENNTDSKLGGYYKYNIEDPYGRDLEEYRNCFRRIEICLEGLFKEIEKR